MPIEWGSGLGSDPEASRRKENKPGQERLNLRELVEMLQENAFYTEVKESLGSCSLDDLLRQYRQELMEVQEILDDGDYENDEEAQQYAEMKADLEQVVGWLEGVKDVATTDLAEVMKEVEEQTAAEHLAEGELLVELATLADGGNALAAEVLEAWRTLRQQPTDLKAIRSVVINNLIPDLLVKYHHERASIRSTLAGEAQAVIRSINRFFPT